MCRYVFRFLIRLQAVFYIHFSSDVILIKIISPDGVCLEIENQGKIVITS